MRHSPWLFAAIAVLLPSDAPSRQTLPPPPPPPAQPTVTPVTFTALTYNAGLAAGMVPLARERAPLVADAVAGMPADLLCMQELWDPAQEDAVIAGLGLPSDRVFRFDTAGLGVNPAERCAAGVLDALSACVSATCGDLDAEAQSHCASTACRGEFIRLYLAHRSCMGCVVSGAGKPLGEVVATCEGSGMSRVFDGNNGVLLASRWPLRAQSALQLPSSRANRVALFARVEVPGASAVEVACTHLSVELPIAPDHGGFATWSDEQAAQLRMVAEQLAARSQDGVPQVLLADLNVGPGYGGAKARSPDVWDRVLREGFACGSLLLEEPRCTACPENPLRTGEDPFLLDHACGRNGSPRGGGHGWRVTPIAAEARFTAPLPLLGRDGHEHRVPPSDHYGLFVTFDLR